MTSNNFSWEEAPHTADLAMKITSSVKSDLFHAALEGLLGLLDFDTVLKSDENKIIHHFSTSAADIENLLVDFLTECVYIMEVHDKIPVKAENLIYEEGTISVDIITREIRESERSEIGHIKAVTYHDLAVILKDGKFTATIVFDT